jgi:phage-related protein
MAETFSYVPDRGFSKTTKPRVLLYQFGDGYAQRTGDGINHIASVFSLTFSGRSVATANAIIAFLVDTGGRTYFLWTPPGESSQIKVIASEWTEVHDTSVSRTISVTFTQVFDL